MGRRLRGLTITQVTELLASAYKTGKETNSEIDIVISRNNVASAANPPENESQNDFKRTRKISLDSFMKSMILDEKSDEYASIAIKYVVYSIFSIKYNFYVILYFVTELTVINTAP